MTTTNRGRKKIISKGQKEGQQGTQQNEGQNPVEPQSIGQKGVGQQRGTTLGRTTRNGT